ncbi:MULTISPECIES: monooxygenase [unclassified Gordonia (in: high G+C Gram-positive bacteria)]
MSDAASVPPVVDLHLFGVDSVFAALQRVARARRSRKDVPGLRFVKVLGTGSGDTFTMRDADLSHWAVLLVWDGSAPVELSYLDRWEAISREHLRIRMRPLSARGRWSRREPFGVNASRTPSREPGPVAAITRARLRPTRMASFWRSVPPVAAALNASSGVRLAVGIGEAPIGVQGTFSLWDDARDLSAFAYRNPEHVSAIRRTTPERWYAEELFARFSVETVDGTYRGDTP